MNKRLTLWTLGFGLAAPLGAQEQMTLEQAVELAQKRGYQSTAAVATRDAARARDRAFGARNRPQLSLTGEAPRYERSILPVIQPDGSTIFTPIQQTTANAGLTVAQRLPFTGGVLSMTAALQRYQRTGGTQQTLSWSSTPVTFELQQPIMRANVLRWESREQDVLIDAAERQYLEAREAIAMRTSGVSFDLYVARRTRENAVKNAAQNDTLYTLNKGRFEVGKIGENDLLQSELALLRARTSLDGARLELDRATAALRLALGLAAGTPLDVTVGPEIPTYPVDTTRAVAEALRNGANVTEANLGELQARRRVTEARLNNGFGATVQASFGFNATASEFDLAYSNLLEARTVALAVEIPLIQWGARSATVQAAKAEQRQAESAAKLAHDQTAQDAHFAALQLEQARRTLALSAKADTVAAKRFEVAYNRYVIGRITIDNLYMAQNEKNEALNQYVQALRGYWMAHYRLRRLTLYDFETGQVIR